jgi:hypothetical protein
VCPRLVHDESARSERRDVWSDSSSWRAAGGHGDAERSGAPVRLLVTAVDDDGSVSRVGVGVADDLRADGARTEVRARTFTEMSSSNVIGSCSMVGSAVNAAALLTRMSTWSPEPASALTS